jgi:nitroimidazol reductase NimA-like FMN-containing flavoprotein (pyridoxamine 5'-phosphate oxidase superfamily)
MTPEREYRPTTDEEETRMPTTSPDTVLDQDFSDPQAAPTTWDAGRAALESAQLYWISTVRPDGRPHVTPLIGVWVDGALHIVTGPTERKARNLAANPHTTVTTGTNALDTGLDVVVEGGAERLTDAAALQRVADAYVAKYGDDWRFTVKDGGFVHDGHEALVFRVAPVTAFGFAKSPYGQTRWRFA